MANILSNFFGTTAFWVVNKHLARLVGIEASLLLNDLYSKQCFFEERGELIEGYFFNTRDNIEADTTLSPHKQRQALQTLEKFGFVKTKVMGLPKKTYYSVIHDKLLNFLTTGDEKISRQEVKKFNTNNNKLIKIKNNIIADLKKSAVASEGKEKKQKIDPQAPQTLIEFVDKCKSSPQAHIRVIGEWAEAIEPKNTTIGEWNSFMRRHLRPAMLLAPYPIDKIEKAYALLRKDLKESGGYMTKFTLETVAKYIDNI